MKSIVSPIKRNASLDYLRGLAAIGVMLYHLSLFSFGESDASTLITRVKIYAVSIFYVLSGLTLFIAYTKSLALNYLDKTSYVIYLMHMLLYIILYGINETFLYWSAYAEIAITVAITIPLGGLAYQYFEKSYMCHFKQTTDNRKAQMVNVTA